MLDARQNFPMAQYVFQPLSERDRSYRPLVKQPGGPLSFAFHTMSMSLYCVSVRDRGQAAVRGCAAAGCDASADAVRVSTAGELQITASRATNLHIADNDAWRLKRFPGWNKIALHDYRSSREPDFYVILFLCHCIVWSMWRNMNKRYFIHVLCYAFCRGH